MAMRYGLTHRDSYWILDSPDFPYGEAYKDGRDWIAYSKRDESITAICASLQEASQFLYYGDR